MKEENEGKVSVTIKGIDRILSNQFKVSCINNNTTMKAAITWYISRYTWPGLKYEISDGESTKIYNNLFVGLEEMLYKQDFGKEITIKVVTDE